MARLLCSMTRLVPVIASGDFPAMVWATRITAASSAARSGNTSETRPADLACSALSVRAVSASSRATPAW